MKDLANDPRVKFLFISAPPAPVLAEAMPGDGDYISVFMPCTPNPTTGFWFYLPASEAIEVALTPDEAFKLIMSAGVIQPGVQKQLGEMAEATVAEKAKA
jgi:uncharacterized membrane protein